MNRYERYKDSGIPWLGEVPEHWEVKRLKFITNRIVDGAHFTPTYVNEGIPFLRVTDIQEKNIDMEKIKYIPLEEHRELIKRCNPQKGDILLSKNGTIGISKKIDWNWEFSIFVSLCLIKFNSLISSHYAKYFFDSYSLQEQIFGLIKKNTVINLHLDKIENFWFVLPSIKEQTAIARYLDTKLGEIDALIDKQQTLLEKLAEQRTAVITHAVTKGLNPAAPMKKSGVEWLGDVPAHWDVKRLKFLGDIILGLTYSPENITNEDNGTLVLRSSNIQNGKLVYEDNVFVNSDIPKRMVTTDKDILICSRNGSRSLIGKCALIEKDGLNQTFGAFMTVYRTPYRKFVYYSLNSEIFKSQLGLFLTSTINQLTTQVLGNFNIAFPPLEEQSSITEYLDNETAKIDRLCETVNQTIGRLKEYRTALITQAVTGKVKVTDE